MPLPILILLVLGYVLVRGAVLRGIVPLWQGPDEPGHTEFAILLAEGQLHPQPAPALEAAILRSMAAHQFYERLGLAVPKPAPEVFGDVPRLGGDPTQLANETPLGYLPYAAAAAMGGATSDVEAALARMRAASLLMVFLVVLAAGWAAQQLLGGTDGPAAAAVVAAAPMLGFGGAVVNNDLPAALLATLWFGLLAGLLARPAPRRAPWALGIVVVAVLAAAAKRTGVFLLPLTAVVVAWQGLGTRAVRRAAWSNGRTLAVAVGCLLAVALAWWWPAPGTPAAWVRVGAPWGAERTAGGRSGGHALVMADSSATSWQYLEQTVSASGDATVAARAWVRSDRPTAVGMVVSDDAGTWLSASAQASAHWQEVRLQGRLAAAATECRLAVFPGDGTSAGTGTVVADDLALDVDGRQVLVNGGAEASARLVTLATEALASYTDARRLAAALPGLWQAPGRTLARAWRGLFFSYKSSFGGFGWLTVWPDPRYDLLSGLLTAVMLCGLLLAVASPRRLLESPDRAAWLRVAGVGTLMAVAASVSGSMAGWGSHSLPQGRYLLPVEVVFAVAGAALAGRLWPRWGPWLLAGLALAVDAALVVNVMMPAFGGR